MIEGLFNRKCKILRRLDNTRDSFNNYQYQLSDDVDCIFKERMGAYIKGSDSNDIVITGILILIESVNEYDKFVIDNYEYDIAKGGIQEIRDPVNDEVSHRRIAVIRRRLYSEESVTINSGVT
jgi:hypothetical protein